MTECSNTESCESRGRPSRRCSHIDRGVGHQSGSSPPRERFAWCNQEAALVCIEHPSYLGCGQQRRVLPSVRVVDFSHISSERTSAFLRREKRQQAVRSGLVGRVSGKPCVLGAWIPKLNCGIGSGGTGFQQHHHIAARRVGLLESVFVTLTLSEGRQRGLAPAMLLHKLKGVGSIGRVELMERANKFARGQRTDLLEELCHSTHSSRPVLARIPHAASNIWMRKMRNNKDAGRQRAME